MKKILLYLLLACSISTFAQAEFPEGIQLGGNASTVNSTKLLNQNPTTGTLDYINATSLPVSTATANALALKANIASPTFTGTVSGITKSMVGLGNVDDTSDLNKPISTATANALATKAPISSAHNRVTIGTANGLSLLTQQLSLGLASSGVNGALSGTDWNTFNGKFNTPTGLITNYLPKWNGSGFGNSVASDNGTNFQIGSTSFYFNKFGVTYNSADVGNSSADGVVFQTGDGNDYIQFLTKDGQYSAIQAGLRASSSRRAIAINPLGGNTLFGKTDDNGVDKLQVNGSGSFAGKLSITGGGISTSISNVASTVTQTISVANPAIKLGIGYVVEDFPMIQSFNVTNASLPLSINPFGGNVGIGTTNITDKLTVNGNITASPAVSPNQVVVKSQLDAADANNVKLTGNQSISGTKTFNGNQFFGNSGSSNPAITINNSATSSSAIDINLSTPTNGYFLQARNGSTVKAVIKDNGNTTVTKLNVNELPIFADNASAITGGLVVGDIYRTSTGELRVRF